MKLEENDRASLVRLMKAKEMMAAAAEKAEKEKIRCKFYVEFYSTVRYTKAERSGYYAKHQTDF